MSAGRPRGAGGPGDGGDPVGADHDRRDDRHRDLGSGTVAVLALVGVVLVLTGLAAAAGAATVARHRAEAAADLSALAAASGPSASTTPDCARAQRVARDGGATLTGCRPLPDGSVVVEVVVALVLPDLEPAGRGGAAPLAAGARARAGPPPVRSSP